MPAVLDLPPPKRLGQRRGSAARPVPVVPAPLEPDHLIILSDSSWGSYLDLDSKVEGSSTRLTCFHRRIDILTLSADHERIKGNLSHMIAAHCFDEEIEFVSHGAATRRIPFELGKEPDDSFIFGTEKKTMPDMVLEVVLTQGFRPPRALASTPTPRAPCRRLVRQNEAFPPTRALASRPFETTIQLCRTRK